MVSSTFTSKGQTTLSKAVRQALRVAARDRVRHAVHNNAVRLLPVRPIVPLFGALKPDGPLVSLEDMERSIAEGACEAAAVPVNRPTDAQTANPQSFRTGDGWFTYNLVMNLAQQR